jgi:GTP-binding protein
MSLTITIAGRPNVGKSTLFNRLVGKHMAIVDDTPGVTRDWREGNGELFDLSFRVIDTAGLEDKRAKGSLAARTAVQTRQALAQTDLVLLMVDAREGLTAEDKAIAVEIRKTGKPIILVGNKCEGTYLPDNFEEFVALGFGEPIAISASHGEGLMELYGAMRERLTGDSEGTAKEDDEEKHLHLAIVGRPNVGKSTLVNKLIGEERMITGPEPGLTRDAIPIGWNYKGKPVRLVDTAGLRRRAKVTEKLEKLSGHETIRAIRLAHVVVLVLDAEQGFEKQDLVIAHHVAEEGRALVIAINKWDAIRDKKGVLRDFCERAEDSLAQLSGLPVVPISALKGEGLKDLMRAVMALYETWNRRVPTNKLNRWLEDVEEDNPPPITSGRRLKLRYMTQIKTRPPTFALWVNKPVDLPESYTRFLTRGLRTMFDLQGVPIRWQMKKGENPYEDKKKK